MTKGFLTIAAVLALVSSEWHESQIYVCTIGGHRFFGEAGE